MSEISVSLSSTEHILAIKGSSPQFLSAARRQNYPLCIAQMCLGLFGWGPDLEYQEHVMANLCKSMAKTVHVNSKNQYVFIGRDPNTPDSGLIEYTENSPNPSSNSFFSQWDNLHSLVMEFNVVGMKLEPLFCIKGLWVIDKWVNLDVYTKSSITVVSSHERGPDEL